MSRQIDIHAGPLSKADREYLESRGNLVALRQNEELFSTEEEIESEASYDEMTNDELRTMLTERGLRTTGSKADLVARLEEDDEAEEE